MMDSRSSYYVYILWSKTLRKRYIGSTEDVEKRLTQHNAGMGVFTRRGLPWILLYTEEFPTRGDAAKRERFLKSGKGRAWLDRNLPQVHSTAGRDLSFEIPDQ